MSEPRIDPRITINELLLRYPSAVSVLNELGIDSCCGGAESLAHVGERDGLDLPALLAALESAMEVQVR